MPKSNKPRGLTAKQKAFVDEYLIDMNATQSAIRAGYSKRTAGQIGDENLKKPQIAHAIAQAQAQRADATGLTASKVLGWLIEDRADAKSAGAHGPAVQATIALGKHLALFTEKVEVSGGLEGTLAAHREKLADARTLGAVGELKRRQEEDLASTNEFLQEIAKDHFGGNGNGSS